MSNVWILSTRQQKRPPPEVLGQPVSSGRLLTTSKPHAIQCPGGEPVLERDGQEGDGETQRPKGRGESAWMVVKPGPVLPPPSATRSKDVPIPTCTLHLLRTITLSAILCWGQPRFTDCGNIQLVKQRPRESLICQARWVLTCGWPPAAGEDRSTVPPRSRSVASFEHRHGERRPCG